MIKELPFSGESLVADIRASADDLNFDESAAIDALTQPAAPLELAITNDEREADFKEGRARLKKILSTADELFTEIAAAARDSADPKMTEVAVKLLTGITSVQESLLSTHDKYERGKKSANNELPQTTSTVNINNANNVAFVGKPSDLLSQKNTKRS